MRLEPVPLKIDAPVSNQDELFYSDPLIAEAIRMENCLSRCDELDKDILRGVIRGTHFQKLAELLFTSPSTIRYRLSRIYKDAGVANRNDFIALIRANLGNMENMVSP